MSSLIGQSLGRYRILEQLGEGGMATVYKAYDTRLARDVAVKVIRRDSLPPQHIDRILKRFQREARMLATLSHPNIVRVLDYGDFDDTPYLVLELHTSGTLRSRLGRPIPWQETIAVLVPIARALEYAHKAHVVHRDVKPSNILLSSDGRPLLTDFGIAKLLESDRPDTLTTGAGVGVGTPEYMAPEQGLGHTVDARADIYSLGIVFYEMITSRAPFHAETPMAVLVQQASEPLPRPSQYVPDLPGFVERFLLKALAKKPQDRFRDMGQVVKAMERMPRQKGALARPAHAAASRTAPVASNNAASQAPTALFEPAPRRSRTRKVVIAVVSLGLLAAAAVLGPRMLAASSAAGSHGTPPGTAEAADTQPAVANLLAAGTATATQTATLAAPQATQPPLITETLAAGPSPTLWPGSVLMDYGTSANGRTQGGWAFYGKQGDIVAIAMYPEAQADRNIYSSLVLKNSSGETLQVGVDMNLSYTMITKVRGIVTAGSQIERYVIPNDGLYYIAAGLSPRGFPQGYFVLVLNKLDK